MNRTVYLDYNASTPLDPGVKEAMLPSLGEIWGNPSSIHHIGRRARAHLDDCRDRAAGVLACKPGEIIFTSGGTEANNLAILGVARKRRYLGRHLVTSAVEHHAVLNAFGFLAAKEGFEVTILPVDGCGRVSPDCVLAALRRDTLLVSIMAANNEIGTLQPVAEIGAACRKRGIVFHTDAAQWIGKEPFVDIGQFQADLVSLCSHKFHGPKGSGLLYVRSPLLLEPLSLGGGQENERRAGTENPASIAGLVAALEGFARNPVFSRDLSLLTDRILASLRQIDGVIPLAQECDHLCNTISFVTKGADSMGLLAGLDMEGICASGGAACSAGSLVPSHVVSALGLDDSLARSLVRFSLGRENTEEEINRVCKILPSIVRRARV